MTDQRRRRAVVPELAPIAAPRLIDVGTLQYEVSVAGLSERYGRGVTPHTTLVWWARRPHSVMRALVFAALCRDRSDEAARLMVELGASGRAPPAALERARRLLREQGASCRVLDAFAGGGTIPLEASSLGAEAWALDANRLAVFINRCALEHAAVLDADRARAAVLASGRRVLDDLERLTAPLFPLRQSADPAGRRVTTSLWSYSIACERCGLRFSLSRRRWLSRRRSRRIALRSVMEGGQERYRIDGQGVSEAAPPVNWAGRRGGARCPACGAVRGRVGLGDADDHLLALVRSARGQGKSFELATASAALPPSASIAALERALLDDLGAELPGTSLPRWSGIVNPALYGLETHADLFNPRQRVVLLALIQALGREHARLVEVSGEAEATFVTGLLSGLIDQLVDWNCRLSMWISQNEQVGRAFCGPGVAMLWDYAETDPMSAGPSNLRAKLERLAEGAAAMAGSSNGGRALVGTARRLPFSAGGFDAVIVDPPYYDNIFYEVLADFFYVWKRLLLGAIEPELFEAERSQGSEELVASRQRSGDDAHEAYCDGLAAALGEAIRVLTDEGVLALVYSHGAMAGWEALARALMAAPLRITSVQPLSIERRQRPRAMASAAVNCCVVLVGRPNSVPRSVARRGPFLEQVAALADAGFLAELRAAGWAEADLALAAFAQGVGVLANTAGLEGASPAEALAEIEGIVGERFPGFALSRRRAL